MLKNLEIKDNKDRAEVLKYIIKNNIDCSKFEISDFLDYPGGIELTDIQNRKILIYNDLKKHCVKEIYIKYKMEKNKLVNDLWNEYSDEAIAIDEIPRLERDNNGNIFCYRYKINHEGNVEKIHQSKIFKESDEMYDIIEYLYEELNILRKRKLQ